MKTVILLLQYPDQEKYIQPFVSDAIGQGFTSFLSIIPLTMNNQYGQVGLVCCFRCESVDDFPDNLFQSEEILLVKNPLEWVCDRADLAIAVWDGADDTTQKSLAYIMAWGTPGYYFNPDRCVVEPLEQL
ncbi:MAG: hypothetical protein N5P05_004098 (plasmid) [Chroococcopsis gigantea SAG 12.99]|jgi:hypothetical protein|nr:hypothetical protein [Chroococcopsis gigantea SAG 12.99]